MKTPFSGVTCAVLLLGAVSQVSAIDGAAVEKLPPADQAVFYFETFCLQPAGDLQQSIRGFSDSAVFKTQSMVERNG